MQRRWVRVFRTGAVGLALLGYISVLAASPAGHGLRLLGHLVQSHSVVSVHPSAVAEFDHHHQARPESPRHAHGHDGIEHAHASHSHETRSEGDLVLQDESPLPGDVHEHNGVAHSHSAPPPEPPRVLTVSLDEHRLPDATPMTSPSPPLEEALGAREMALISIEGTVETPPPLGRS